MFVEYCPTEEMWADVLTLSLQGRTCRTQRSMLMNMPADSVDPTTPSPLTGVVQTNIGVSWKKPLRKWKPYNPEEMINNRKHSSYASAVAHRSVLVNEVSAKFLAKKKNAPQRTRRRGSVTTEATRLRRGQKLDRIARSCVGNQYG